MEYLIYGPCFFIPFILLFTKLHDGYVTIGDVVIDSIIGAVPVINAIAAVYLFCQTCGRRKWLSKRVF
jgi:hypothetical protein